jgi:hypothetical protein
MTPRNRRSTTTSKLVRRVPSPADSRPALKCRRLPDGKGMSESIMLRAVGCSIYNRVGRRHRT